MVTWYFVTLVESNICRMGLLNSFSLYWIRFRKEQTIAAWLSAGLLRRTNNHAAKRSQSRRVGRYVYVLLGLVIAWIIWTIIHTDRNLNCRTQMSLWVTTFKFVHSVVNTRRTPGRSGVMAPIDKEGQSEITGLSPSRVTLVTWGNFDDAQH